MYRNYLKSIVFIILGFIAGALLLGSFSKKETSSLEALKRLSEQNAAGIKRTEALMVSIKNELNAQSGKLSVFEKKVDLLQGKVDQLNKAQVQPAAGEDFSKVFQINIGDSPVKGAKNAPVTLVMFVDLQCPFCTRYYQPALDVVKAYPDKVNFVIKNFPLSFHKSAMPAAKLALAANEQGKYFEMVQLLLENKADVSEIKIKEYAKKLKINLKKLLNAYSSKDAEWAKQISEDMKLANQSDVRGTPTFYINGVKTRARDLETFKKEIDQALLQKK